MDNSIIFSRSKLAASLIKPDFLKPVDTIKDMLDSPSELWATGKGATQHMLKTDPRQGVQKLYERFNAINYKQWTGSHEPWFFDRFV